MSEAEGKKSMESQAESFNSAASTPAAVPADSHPNSNIIAETTASKSTETADHPTPSITVDQSPATNKTAYSTNLNSSSSSSTASSVNGTSSAAPANTTNTTNNTSLGVGAVRQESVQSMASSSSQSSSVYQPPMLANSSKKSSGIFSSVINAFNSFIDPDLSDEDLMAIDSSKTASFESVRFPRCLNPYSQRLDLLLIFPLFFLFLIVTLTAKIVFKINKTA
jgi:hypothetical protein